MGKPFLTPGAEGVGADEKKSQKETTPDVQSVWSESAPLGHRAEHMAAATEFGGAMSPSGRLDAEQVHHVGQKPGQRYEYDLEAGAVVAAETDTIKMSMPEACVLSTAHQHRDGPSGKTPQQTTQLLARMPEPCIPSTFQRTAGQTMPEPSIPPLLPVPPAVPPQRYDAIVDDDSNPFSTASLKTTGLKSSDLASTTLGAIIPPSTYDPDSLPAPQWTTTTSAARKETPQTTVEDRYEDEYDDDDDTSTVVAAQGTVMKRIASILENIPRSERRKMTKEQVAVIVYQALNERRGMSSRAELSGTANPTARQTEGLLPTFIAPSSFLAPFADPTLAYEAGECVDVYTVPASWQRNDAEWFLAQGGGVLPSGWSAQYDHAVSLWYFCDYNTFPPTSTWQDPRGSLSLPERAMLPMAVAGSGVEQIAPVVPLAPQLISEGGTAAAPARTGLQPALTRQEADHLVSQFTAFEAQRAVGDSVKDGPKGGNSKGPVTNEIQREEREAKEIERALQTTQTAARRADDAIKRGDVERFQIAQEEMIRARGVLDRISNDALLRQSIIPASLNAYQGTTRGFDQDPLYSRPRMHYTNTTTNNRIHPTQCDPALPMGRALPQPIVGLPPHNSYPTVMPNGGNNNNTSSSFAGKIMGKLMKPKGSTQVVYPGMMMPPGAFPPASASAPALPTAWLPLPLPPPGSRYQPSLNTPTPYSMPEFCFAWDMLLRSRRDPYTAAAMRQ